MLHTATSDYWPVTSVCLSNNTTKCSEYMFGAM